MKLNVITYTLTLFIISSCSSQENNSLPEVKTQELVMDPPKETSEKIPDSNILNCILLNNDSIYCYRGNEIRKGTFYSINGKNSYRACIQKLKAAVSDSLVVIIKPTLLCTYKTTVDVLDEMTINGVTKYAMIALNEAEKSFLKTEDYDWAPPEPIAITTPASVTSQTIPKKNAIIIELRKDQSVWYTILGAGFDSLSHIVKKPVTQNLKSVIADFEKKLSGIRKDYLIKGDKDARYTIFEQVIEALKQNNIYKYNLVTEESQQKEPGLLMPRKEN